MEKISVNRNDDNNNGRNDRLRSVMDGALGLGTSTCVEIVMTPIIYFRDHSSNFNLWAQPRQLNLLNAMKSLHFFPP